jgi:pSer/pThr/pTyr-binding forkhead associated (FHA) protein
MAADTPTACLVYAPGTAQERVWPITGDVVTIGRVPGNDVQVPDRTVSRFHARIRRHADAFHVADSQSTSGTFVDGDHVVGDRLLVGGETIRVGGALLLFRRIPEP